MTVSCAENGTHLQCTQLQTAKEGNGKHKQSEGIRKEKGGEEGHEKKEENDKEKKMKRMRQMKRTGKTGEGTVRKRFSQPEVEE